MGRYGADLTFLRPFFLSFFPAFRCVLNGTGTGQCRRLVASSADGLTWTVASAFAQTLDASSIITIIPWVGHLMWYKDFDIILHRILRIFQLRLP